MFPIVILLIIHKISCSLEKELITGLREEHQTRSMHLNPGSTTYKLCGLRSSHTLSEPRFPHLENGNKNGTCLIGLWEEGHVAKCLAEDLAFSEGSINDKCWVQGRRGFCAVIHFERNSNHKYLLRTYFVLGIVLIIAHSHYSQIPYYFSVLRMCLLAKIFL